MRQTWQVVLDRLRVDDPNEEAGFPFPSDGDEPQLAVIVFRSTYGRAGSTKVWRQPFDSSLWPEGVDGGASIPVPPSVGVFGWPPVSSPWVLGSDPEILGFAVVATERDATPQALIADKIDDAVEALQAGLVDLIENRHLAVFDPAEAERQIGQLTDAVKEAQSFSPLERLGVFVGSAFDSDEVIGSQHRIWTNVRNAPASVEFLWPRAFELSFVEHGEDTAYTVTGRLELVAEELEFVPHPDATDPACRPLPFHPVPLPRLVQAAKDGETRLQVEILLDDHVHPTRRAFGTNLRYLPGEHRPPNGPFIPGGHYGEKLVMDTVECVGGRPSTQSRWRAQLLLGHDIDTAFGTDSAPSLLVHLDDVHVYYQPLTEVGDHWEGADPNSRLQVFCRRYEAPR